MPITIPSTTILRTKLDDLPNEIGARILHFLDPRDVKAVERSNHKCRTYGELYWGDFFKNKNFETRAQCITFVKAPIRNPQPFWLPKLHDSVISRTAPKGCRINAIEVLFRSSPTNHKEIINLLEQTHLFDATEIEHLASLPERQLLYFTFPRVIMPMVVKGRRIDIAVCVALFKKKLEDRNGEDLKHLLHPINKRLKPLLDDQQILYLEALHENDDKLRFLLTDGAIVTFLSASKPDLDLSKFSRLPDEYFKADVTNIYLHALNKGRSGEFDAEQMRACGMILPTADASGYAALHHVLRPMRIDNNRLLHLLENGAGVGIDERGGEKGLTPLHLAAKNIHDQPINLLVRFGAQCLKNFNGDGPLHYAVDKRCFYASVALVNAFPEEVKSLNSARQTPLHLAAAERPPFWGGIDALASASQSVINLQDKDGRTAMWYLAFRGFVAGAKALYTAGANANVPDNLDYLPLHAAAYNNHVEMIRALCQELGANVDQQDKKKRTVLHYAVEAGKIEVVRVLIEVNARGDLPDENGELPVHIGVRKGYAEIVRLLLTKDPKTVNAQNEEQQTPLQLAIMEERLEMIRILCQEFEPEINYQTDEQPTALYVAAVSGQTEAVKLLLTAKANCALPTNKSGKLPVHAAARRGYAEIVRLLLEKDAATLEIKDKKGRTPRDVAKNEAVKEEIDKILQSLSTKIS